MIEADGCVFDLGRCVVARGADQIELSAREADLLRYLHRHRSRAVPRAEILAEVFGVAPTVETRSVDVAIGALRKKIERRPEAPQRSRGWATPGASGKTISVDLPAELVERCAGGGVVVLTGAGASTESGIPDYRSPGRPVRPPLQHREFVTSPATRARYWARSALGWPVMSRARPNPAHTGIAALEGRGRIAALITQNVDGLHAAAGSRAACELHGSIHRVVCLTCGRRTSRASIQDRLLADNPRLASAAATPMPDGDAELPAELAADLQVPACGACGGVLKPDVVLFGDSVPRPTVERCYASVDAARLLLVVGSSLTVFSGYRFAIRAAERAIPIAIVNLGPTRADPMATWRIPASAGAAIGALAERAGAR